MAGGGIDRDVAGLDASPGARLAAALADTVPQALDGDGLLTAISSWHRLGAWVKAGELSAIAAFLNARTKDRPGSQAFDAAVSEIELELTLTGAGSTRLLELAVPLSDRLPATMRALRDGLIDEAKARVIARAVTGILDPATARAVERQVLPEAAGRTTGQLRATAERAVIAVDPRAADRRRIRAEAGRRVEIRPTDAHTSDLCGRDLPADQALAADQRITALAKALKHHGDAHSLTFLRAQVFVSLLLGTGPAPVWPAAADLPDRPADDCQGAGGGNSRDHTGGGSDDRTRVRPGTAPVDDPAPATDRHDTRPGPGPHAQTPGMTGTVHVIIPIDTLSGISDQPGEVPGYGPVTAPVARAIAVRASDRRWCYTITDRAGQGVAHGHTHPRVGATGHPSLPATDIGLLAEDITDHDCDTKGKYRPSGALRHLVEIRDRTCRFPGCRRPACACDLDHTVPYDSDGPTCACNLAPLCRRHHQLKQIKNWTLTQPKPGRLKWETPSGRQYPVTPDPYLE